MSVVIKDLSEHEAERHAMEAQAARIADTPKPQVNVHGGREFVFVAHFDGTLLWFNFGGHLDRAFLPL